MGRRGSRALEGLRSYLYDKALSLRPVHFSPPRPLPGSVMLSCVSFGNEDIK